MITKILRNTSLGLIFLIPFIPLYVSNSLFFPFITGKAFAFRIIIEIAFALWLLLILRDKKYAPKFSWLSLGVTVFAVAMLVADLLGVNPLRSLWSNFERMEGWVMISHLWAYFIVTTSIFGSGDEGRRMWHTFFKVTLTAASIVGIYGFFQLFHIAAIHQGSSRIDASLGNAAYMAVYMLIHAFIAFYMMLVTWGKKNSGISWWYLVLGVIFTFLLFETATRGTILGLVGGIMLALGIYAVFGKGESRKSRWLSGGAIIVIILLGVGLVAAKNTSFVKSSETLDRLASISISDTTTQARGYIWPVAVKGVFQSPKTTVIGWGQENFNYIFNANYNPKMWSQEQWFDRAHNVFLDWLVAGGLVGFLLYISLSVFAVVGIWKSMLTFKEKCLMTGLFVGYAIHNIFVFDNIASYLLFFALLGFVHSLRAEKPLSWLEKSDIQSENTIVVRDYIFFPIILVAFLCTLYFVNIRPIQANTRLITALNTCSASATTDAFASALALNQYEANQEIREQLFGCAGNIISGSAAPQTKNNFYDLTIKEIGNQINVAPLDARGYVLAGTYLNSISDWQHSQPLLEKANQLSPHKQSIIFQLATNYMNSGKEKEAAALLKEAYESAPDNDTAKIGYVSTLILSGQEKLARELFAATPELFLDTRVINVYAKLGQYQKVIESYKALVEKNPDNVQYYAGLAQAYVQNKQSGAAISLLESIKAKFPQLKDQIEAAIAQIKQQTK